ncbi:type II secretion system protein N [Vitreimonas sp.]|uniref:type II secretion system protein N n=1 Tax=Vitreimonas sp. TaxID=3069702 RepID=UPI002ED82378
MARARKNLLSTSAENVRERAISAVRPSVEALLLAAVALGCAQAGWSIFTPSTASAVSASGEGDRETHRLNVSEVVSPFAPDYLASDAQSHAVAALLSGVQLTGVRVSTEPMRSGAVLTLADGAQRAFSIGDDIGAGIMLADVGADYVLVSYQGGQRQIEMTSAPSYSFARAMMGLEPAPGAPVIEEQTTAPAASVASNEPSSVTTSPFATVEAPQAPALIAPTSASPQDVAWLQATLAQVQTLDGQPSGWRVAEPLPQAALDAGLRGGDVVVAINGANPAQAASLLAAPPTQQIELAVERDGQRLTLTINSSDRT